MKNKYSVLFFLLICMQYNFVTAAETPRRSYITRFFCFPRTQKVTYTSLRKIEGQAPEKAKYFDSFEDRQDLYKQHSFLRDIALTNARKAATDSAKELAAEAETDTHERLKELDVIRSSKRTDQ